jgi:hypothetical protein
MADSANYTVRVELHDADGDDYEELHGYMQQEGFARYIVDGETKEKFQLPTAEYNISSAEEKGGVLDKAKRAAAKTRKEFMVLVTKSAGRTWENLPKWKS